MVNLGLRRVEESVAAKHPVGAARPPRRGWGGREPGRCPDGVSAGAAAVRGVPVPRLHEGHRHLPGRQRSRFRRAEAAAGSLASYMVTKAETQKCSDFWIYLETGKSPRERAMADGVSQPTENLSPEDAEKVAPHVRRNKYGDIVE
ncbi:transmembrane protein 141 isoform X1 [Anser cygnoides]|uniref:transmembrane protein 141 isoform X1 n=1 Tax=Anser cygnoides TaxID=8845 RepID=UPI0034D2AF6D